MAREAPPHVARATNERRGTVEENYLLPGCVTTTSSAPQRSATAHRYTAFRRSPVSTARPADAQPRRLAESPPMTAVNDARSGPPGRLEKSMTAEVQQVVRGTPVGRRGLGL